MRAHVFERCEVLDAEGDAVEFALAEVFSVRAMRVFDEGKESGCGDAKRALFAGRIVVVARNCAWHESECILVESDSLGEVARAEHHLVDAVELHFWVRRPPPRL